VRSCARAQQVLLAKAAGHQLPKQQLVVIKQHAHHHNGGCGACGCVGWVQTANGQLQQQQLVSVSAAADDEYGSSSS
jgi:hypothetical protein